MPLASSVTRNEVTWTFDDEYLVGQYANGDWWVAGSPIIQSVTPAYSAGRHGSMINPSNHGNSSPQGFDDRLHYWNASARITYPYQAAPGQSVCQAVSNTATGTYTQTWLGRNVSESNGRLRGFEVLTVVGGDPGAGALRPPFMGTAKPQWYDEDIDASLLPGYAPPAGFPADLTVYERGLERPWLMSNSGWTARAMHPLENMPNYHEQVLDFLNEATVALLTNAASTALIRRYVQLGIDWYAASQQSGSGGSSAYTRVPIIIAGLLLGSNAMMNWFRDGSPNNKGREDKLFYFWPDRETTRSSSIVPAGQTWTGATVFFRKQTGNTEHEHFHPSEWGEENVANGGGRKQEVYRLGHDSAPHVGFIVAVRVLGLEVALDHPAYVAYMDRWMSEPYGATYKSVVEQYWATFSGSGQNGSEGWVTNAWHTYAAPDPGEDTTPPNVANLQVQLTQTSATISFTTNEPADSLIEYGPTAAYGSQVALDPALRTSHSRTISGLAPSTVYHYRIRARDAASNVTWTADASFETLAEGIEPPPAPDGPQSDRGGLMAAIAGRRK